MRDLKRMYRIGDWVGVVSQTLVAVIGSVMMILLIAPMPPSMERTAYIVLSACIGAFAFTLAGAAVYDVMLSWHKNQ